MNATVKNSGTKKVALKVVSKAEQKTLSIPTKKVVSEKAILKAVTKKVVSNGLHKALLECNKLDKLENQSLSGALKRLKAQIELNDTYKGIDTNLISEALKYDNLLANVSVRCLDTKKFSVYSLGLAVNKFLKPLIKK